MHILDTSAIIELLYGTEKGQVIRETVQNEPFFLSTLAIHELLVGCKEKEIAAVKNLFQEISVADFDLRAAVQSARIERALRQKGKLINKVDILIGGLCISRGATLVTCDGDFESIPHLTLKKV